MVRYIGKRILMMIPVILGISFIIFTIMNFTPGDPARLVLGETATYEEIETWRENEGLNDNFFVRYGRYIKNALQGDFGITYTTNISVTKELGDRLPSTMKLAFGSVVLMVSLGVPIGIISAVKQYSLIDRISLVTALLLTSMPAFWLGLMLILFFSLRLGWFPATGIATWKNYILPCSTLAAAMMASLVRMTRSNMLEVIKQDYIRTARAKGSREMVVIYKHALRNALLPIITIIGLNFGSLLGGTVIIESVFAMPGIGTLTLNAIRMKDTPMVMANVLFIALLAGFINLTVDILYAFVDPRIRAQYAKN
ncbi:MAG: ABC transporter permease [Eubacteriales bacterium]|nr:ABC transporter permease [Eubacteriales bacterium]